jgi:hypothetical protein
VYVNGTATLIELGAAIASEPLAGRHAVTHAGSSPEGTHSFAAVDDQLSVNDWPAYTVVAEGVSATVTAGNAAVNCRFGAMPIAPLRLHCMPIVYAPATGILYDSEPLAALPLDQASLSSRLAVPVPQQVAPAGALQVNVKGICATTFAGLIDSVTGMGVWPVACVLNEVPLTLTVSPPV